MNNNTNRWKYFWMSLLPAIALFVLMNGLSIFIVEIMIVYVFRASSSTDMSSIMDGYLDLVTKYLSPITLFIYGFIALFLTYLWYKKVFKDSTKIPDYLGEGKRSERLTLDGLSLKNYKKANIWGLVLSAIGFQVVMQFYTVGLSKAFPSWAKMYSDLLEESGMTSDTLWGLLLVYVIIGPLSEELCFRGLTFEYARKSMPFWAVNILQALFFGLFHGNPLQGSMAFFLGLVLGYIYGKTRNIKLTMIFHVTFNISTFFISSIDITKMNGVAGFAYLLIGLLVSYFGIVIFLKGVPRNLSGTQNNSTQASNTQDY